MKRKPATSSRPTTAAAKTATIAAPRTTAKQRPRATAADGDVSEDALKLWVVLARAYAAVARHAEEDVGRHGLTVAEFGILEALYHKGPMLLGEVQKRILVSSGGITFLVDRLAEKGLVERRECTEDRRARYAALTKKGEKFMKEVFPKHAEAIRRAMGGLSHAEQKSVTNALRTLGFHASALSLPRAEDPSVARPASISRGVKRGAADRKSVV